MHNHPDLTPAVSPLPPDLDEAKDWSFERLQATARSRHKYASPDEGEEYLKAYFNWSGPCYNVVHRPIFIRTCKHSLLLKNRRHGPFRTLLLAISAGRNVHSGIRFIVGMDPETRRRKAENFLSIGKTLMLEEIEKPSSIPTIRALTE